MNNEVFFHSSSRGGNGLFFAKRFRCKTGESKEALSRIRFSDCYVCYVEGLKGQRFLSDPLIDTLGRPYVNVLRPSTSKEKSGKLVEMEEYWKLREQRQEDSFGSSRIHDI